MTFGIVSIPSNYVRVGQYGTLVLPFKLESPMSEATKERAFQTDILEQLEANGWLVGSPDRYNRELAP